MSRNTKSNRNRTLGAVGGALALGGLGWYLYTTWSGSSSSSSADGDSSTSTSGQTASGSSSSLFGGAKKRGPPPTLSLSFPPTFVCTATTVRLLQQLIGSVSQHYTVTLIVPSSSLPAAVVPEESLTVVDHLTMCLDAIPSFDCRRILEYGKEEGRLTLARALASDAHCEVMLERTAGETEDDDDDDDEDSLFGNEIGGGGGGGGVDDGDKTPRAASPAPAEARQVNGVTPGRLVRSDSQNHALNTVLETYHAEMARVRKSSGLLIFLLLPVPSIRSTSSSTRRKQEGTFSTSDMWTMDIESVLRPFLMPGQRDLSARVPGVKVIDERLPIAVSTTHNPATTKSNNGRRSNEPSSEKTVPAFDRAWTEAAQRIAQLGQGWS